MISITEAAAVVLWVVVVLAVSSYVAALMWAEARVRSMEARSTTVTATVQWTDGSRVALEWNAEPVPRRIVVPFNPQFVEGTLEVGDTLALFVERDDSTRVHIEGDATTVVGGFNATLLGAAPLPLLIGLIVALAMTGTWLRRRHADAAARRTNRPRVADGRA